MLLRKAGYFSGSLFRIPVARNLPHNPFGRARFFR